MRRWLGNRVERAMWNASARAFTSDSACTPTSRSCGGPISKSLGTRGSQPKVRKCGEKPVDECTTELFAKAASGKMQSHESRRDSYNGLRYSS